MYHVMRGNKTIMVTDNYRAATAKARTSSRCRVIWKAE